MEASKKPVGNAQTRLLAVIEALSGREVFGVNVLNQLENILDNPPKKQTYVTWTKKIEKTKENSLER